MSLQERLEETYDVDVDIQLAIAEGTYVQPNVPSLHQDRFTVDDDDKATWALRKLARIRLEMAANQEQAEREIERIRAWLDEVNGSLERHAEFFDSHLRYYHRTILNSDPSRKTVKLPAGTLKARKRPDTIEIVEPEAFIEWARVARPEFIRTKFEINKSVVREAVLKDGEVIEGVEAEPGDISFSVEVAE